MKKKEMLARITELQVKHEAKVQRTLDQFNERLEGLRWVVQDYLKMLEGHNLMAIERHLKKAEDDIELLNAAYSKLNDQLLKRKRKRSGNVVQLRKAG